MGGEVCPTWACRRPDWSHEIPDLQAVFQVSVSVVVQLLQVWWGEPRFISEVASSSSQVSLPRLPASISSGSLDSASPHTPHLSRPAQRDTFLSGKFTSTASPKRPHPCHSFQLLVWDLKASVLVSLSCHNKVPQTG